MTDTHHPTGTGTRSARMLLREDDDGGGHPGTGGGTLPCLGRGTQSVGALDAGVAGRHSLSPEA